MLHRAHDNPFGYCSRSMSLFHRNINRISRHLSKSRIVLVQIKFIYLFTPHGTS